MKGYVFSDDDNETFDYVVNSNIQAQYNEDGTFNNDILLAEQEYEYDKIDATDYDNIICDIYGCLMEYCSDNGLCLLNKGGISTFVNLLIDNKIKITNE